MLGPTGPVPGATVHIERLVGDAVGVADIQSDPAGHYHMQGILGGRYRVRAFVPHPIDLAQTQPVIFFLANTEAKPLNLLRSLSAGNTSAMELSPWFVNAFSRALLLTRRRLPHGSFLIDSTGVVRWQSVGEQPELSIARLLEAARQSNLISDGKRGKRSQ